MDRSCYLHSQGRYDKSHRVGSIEICGNPSISIPASPSVLSEGNVTTSVVVLVAAVSPRPVKVMLVVSFNATFMIET